MLFTPSHSRSFLRVASVLTVLLGAAAFPAYAAKPTWVKLEAREFTIYSDAPEKQLLESAVRYAAFRRAFSELFVEPGRSLPPSMLILFRTEKSFNEHLPRSRKSGMKMVNYSTEVDGTPLTAFALAGDRDRALALTFEFETIWALPRAGHHVPIWMSQGSGEILAALTLHKGRLEVGDQSNHPRDELFSWPRFFDISKSSKEYQDNEDLAKFLRQSWSLMHWVLFKDDSTRERFAALAARLRIAPGLEAVEVVMDTPESRFTRAIDQHLGSMRKLREIPFEEAAVRAAFRLSPAPEAEVLAHTANLFAATGEIAKCDAQLDRARALAPDLPAVKEAWARRMLREGRQPDAVALYREAIAAGSTNIAAHLRSAETRLNDNMTRGNDVAGEGGPQAVIALEEIRRGLRLDPGSDHGYRLLGRALFVAPQITREDVAELSQGLGSGENDGALRYYRSLLYYRLKQPNEAQADLRHIARDPQASEPHRRAALRRLTADTVQRDSTRIESLVSEKDYAAARAIVAAADAVVDDESAVAHYEKLGAWIDEQEAWAGVRALHAAESWTELQSAVEKFIERFPKSSRLRAAKQLLAEAAKRVAAASTPTT